MQTITKQYNVYKYEELSQEAKEKALQEWNRFQDYPFLQNDLIEYIKEALKEQGYKLNGDITTYFDLSYSQGSGLMFEGIIEDKKGNVYTIKQSGHYYHEYSTNIEAIDKNGEYIDYKEFQANVYVPLCKKIRDIGYEMIEYMQSEEAFIEACKANEYTFLEDGTIFNV